MASASLNFLQHREHLSSKKYRYQKSAFKIVGLVLKWPPRKKGYFNFFNLRYQKAFLWRELKLFGLIGCLSLSSDFELKDHSSRFLTKWCRSKNSSWKSRRVKKNFFFQSRNFSLLVYSSPIFFTFLILSVPPLSCVLSVSLLKSFSLILLTQWNSVLSFFPPLTAHLFLLLCLSFSLVVHLYLSLIVSLCLSPFYFLSSSFYLSSHEWHFLVQWVSI